jgi:hypothetical protein
MRRRLGVAVLASLLSLHGATVARAQQAPIGQAEGGQGAPGGGGGGGQALPLNLPGERHGLPVPIGLAFSGGTQVGEGGVGWSVPLSVISQNDTFSRQRPRGLLGWQGPALPPADHPEIGRATLSLLGQSGLLVPIDNQGHFRVMLGDQAMEATKQGATWFVTDGSGRRYRFDNLDGLSNKSLWLLTEIASGHHAQSKVTLHYRVQPRQLGGLTTPELFLEAVRYNYDPSGACAKHEVNVKYGVPARGGGDDEVSEDPNAPPPMRVLGTSVVNGRLLVRTELATHVIVYARGNGCGSGTVALHTYELQYVPDSDTRMPRLGAVNVYGQSNTAEGKVRLPVARYVYGRSTYTDKAQSPVLLYGEREPLALPANHLGRVYSNDDRTSHGTIAGLVDMDGDGLLDYVDRDPATASRRRRSTPMWIATRCASTGCSSRRAPSSPRRSASTPTAG